jgi:CBS domain-containing protein
MLTAKDIMSTDMVTVTLNTSLKELAAKFVASRFSNMPVLDETGTLVGIISETDLIEQQKPLHIPTVMALFEGVFYLDSEKRFRKEVDRVTAQTVGELYNSKIVTCAPDATLREIAGLMSKHKAHLIPVMEKDNMIGVVARLDLIKAVED